MDILMDLLHNYTISIKNNTLMAKKKQNFRLNPFRN